MALEAPDWRASVWEWPGGDDCNGDRPVVVAWIPSLGLDPDRLDDRAAIVVDGQGRHYLHVDEIYKVAGSEPKAGPDASDPLYADQLLTRRRIVEIEAGSWPVLSEVL